MLAIQPPTHGIFRKFFELFKYIKAKWEHLLKTIEDSELYVDE